MPGGGTTATAQAPPNEAVLQAIEAADGAGVTVAAVTAATGFPTDVVEAEMAALLRGTHVLSTATQSNPRPTWHPA